MAANPFDDNDTERTVADELIVTQSERLNRLTVALDKHRLAFQNSEATLITRIADVDDEHRRAVNQISKQYTSLRDRLKTTRILTLSLIAGLVILITMSLGGFYMHTQQKHTELVAEIAELRDMANTLQRQIPDNAVQNKVIQERLTQLSLRVTGLARAVAPTASVTPPSLNEPAPIPTPPPPLAVEKPALDSAATVNSEATTEIKPVPFNPALEVDAAPAPTTAVNTPQAATSSAATETVAVTDTLYSLQLIGFFSFAELMTYVQKVPLPPRVFYQTETFRGRPWFVLIHSLHTSYASAKTTIAQFPPALAELDVWIRKLPADATVTALNIQSTAAPAQP
ncbi:hypothetical protein CKO12_07055 [Chromatium okenii]|uniref:SPOR domain-containing protein n=1 Tax=Chromatium okenii TaxID=61644 RepID=UPI001902FDEA|nr:hypothetical protein [Chromatium okenii]MBK1641636.1 hypothetical protein [Chromatium okenii]